MRLGSSNNHLKNQAHAVFDRIWKTGRMTRKRAYSWMRDLLGVREESAHISCLNDAQLEELISWSSRLLATIPKPSRRRA